MTFSRRTPRALAFGENMGLCRDNGKENGNYSNGLYRFNIGLYGWLSKLWSLFGYPIIIGIQKRTIILKTAHLGTVESMVPFGV